MKNILFSIFTEDYPRLDGGGPNHIIYDIIKNAPDQDYSCDYLSYSAVQKNISKVNIDNLASSVNLTKKVSKKVFDNISLYRSVVASSFYKIFHNIKRKNYFLRNFPDSDYDLIHAHDSIILNFAPKNSKAKKIVTIHSKSTLSDEFASTIPNKIIRKGIVDKLIEYEHNSVAQADIITFPSKAAKEIFCNKFGNNLEDKDVRIIYNGIDVERIKNIAKDPGIVSKYNISHCKDFTILNVATHTPEKRIDLMLEVISILINKYDKDIMFINIGTGSETARLKNLAVKYGIENNVKFLGAVENQDVIRFMKYADIFLMLSEKVIFDLVILEALASGICVMASHNGGNKEIIDDGVNGYLVADLDPQSIAKKIISIDSERTITMGETTIQNFTSSKMAQNYFKLYDELI